MGSQTRFHVKQKLEKDSSEYNEALENIARNEIRDQIFKNIFENKRRNVTIIMDERILIGGDSIDDLNEWFIIDALLQDNEILLLEGGLYGAKF